MLPQTHLLTGLVLAIILRLLTPLTPMDFAISSLLSVLYDVDHFYAYFKSYGKISVRDVWNKNVNRVHKDRTLLHRKHGIYVIAPIVAVASIFSLKYGALILLTYAAHMFLDYVYYEFLYSIKRVNFQYPISYEELGIDVGLLAVILIDVFK